MEGLGCPSLEFRFYLVNADFLVNVTDRTVTWMKAASLSQMGWTRANWEQETS